MGISRYPAFPAPSRIEGQCEARLGRETRREKVKLCPTGKHGPVPIGHFRELRICDQTEGVWCARSAKNCST